MSLPRDIHRAIGRLLTAEGEREDVGNNGELEDAWNLVREWWEIEPVEDRDSEIDPYPESKIWLAPCDEPEVTKEFRNWKSGNQSQ